MRSRAVHAWSLHRTLGSFVAEHSLAPGGTGPVPRSADPGLTVLELPAELARRGFDTVQLCHFHLASREAGYLSELRWALADASITLDALLIDAGDLVHPDHGAATEEWVAGWLDVAGQLGATRARVIAGQAPPTPELIELSAERLGRLARQSPVRVVTENWMALLPSATEVRQLLDATGGEVGLLVDLANWTGADRDRQLAEIGGLAETSHAKCRSRADGSLDTDDYRGALEAVLGAGFTGPLALVHDGPDPDEWAALEGCQRVVDEVLADRSRVL